MQQFNVLSALPIPFLPPPTAHIAAQQAQQQQAAQLATQLAAQQATELSAQQAAQQAQQQAAQNTPVISTVTMVCFVCYLFCFVCYAVCFGCFIYSLLIYSITAKHRERFPSHISIPSWWISPATSKN